MSLAKFLSESFLDSEFGKQALTHRSVSTNNNERLEYLGDSLLGFFIAEWLFSNFPEHPEGDLTKLRAHLVKKDTLAEIARELDLSKYIKLGAGELKSGGSRRSSILADAVEALIGAKYLTEGIDATKDFVFAIYEKKLEQLPSIDQLKDSKTRLQELLQSKGAALPIYKIQSKTGKSGDEIFTIECQVEGLKGPFIGVGKNRRKAEQSAAELAYESILNAK